MAHSMDCDRHVRFGATCCLPAAVLSVLLSLPVATGRAATPPSTRSATTSTYQPPTLRQQIESVSTRDVLTLHLYVGGPVSGKFAGFLGEWSDTVASEIRYANWRSLQSGYLPKIGEPIVVTMASGDSLRGTFEGPWSLGLAFRPPGAPVIRPLRMAEFVAVRSTEGPFVTSADDFTKAFASAPQLVAVGLDQGASGAVLVSRSSIVSVAGSSRTSQSGSQEAVLVLLGVAVAVMICATMLENSAKSASNSASTCQFPDLSPGAVNVDRSFGGATPSRPQAMWRKGDTRRP